MDKIILNLINQNIDSQIILLFIQYQIEAITQNDKSGYPERPTQEAKTILNVKKGYKRA